MIDASDERVEHHVERVEHPAEPGGDQRPPAFRRALAPPAEQAGRRACSGESSSCRRRRRAGARRRCPRPPGGAQLTGQLVRAGRIAVRADGIDAHRDVAAVDARTMPSRAIRTARPITSSAEWMTEPGRDRGVSEPSAHRRDRRSPRAPRGDPRRSRRAPQLRREARTGPGRRSKAHTARAIASARARSLTAML